GGEGRGEVGVGHHDPGSAMTGRVLLLGGTGYVGRPAARFLVRSAAVRSLTIAGRNLDRAAEFAAGLGGMAQGKARAVAVDAGDPESLLPLMAEHDLVVNATGGTADLIAGTLAAAIRAGVDYCDTSGGQFCAPLLAQHAAARAAGIRAVIGIGANPGGTNLMAKHLAARFESVETVQSCFVQGVLHWIDPILAAGGPGGKIGAGSAATVADILKGASGRVPVFRDGELTAIDGPGEAMTLPLPGGGTVTAIPYGGSEPMTLPRSIPGLRAVTCRAAFQPDRLTPLFRAQAARIASGEASREEAARAFLEAIVADPDHWVGDARDMKKVVPFTVMTGLIDGQPATVSATLAARFDAEPEPAGCYTAAPLATCAEMMLDGTVAAMPSGAHPPEAVLDPLPFFERLSGLWSPASMAQQTVIERRV
ncbi:MAG: saccharopine dehydrogenase NADP-binding domain-containing protein, partial [Proteobacteria bacterium]|nr:saccharopine dehydrogenase NADP-binding domain-containing protein [Pseudomonadota bacterium]